MIALQPPLDPGAEEARRWLIEELARPEYDTSPSLLERLITWIIDLFDRIDGAGPPGLYVLLAVLAVAALVVVGLVVAGPVRRGRGRAARVGMRESDDERSAAQLRAAAEAAAAQEAWNVAVVERFRAVIRSLEERLIIEPATGSTAQEAAHAASDRLPAQALGLHHGAVIFDRVLYGHHSATRDDDQEMRALDLRVGTARASVPRAGVADGGVAGVAGFAGTGVPDADVSQDNAVAVVP
ncbi:MAG: DUF4129 domain-containing protein [Cellulomonadaceae bacterium]|nr:DUF4129 domain-containing protein [Cellulomonadaceae bacterium]